MEKNVIVTDEFGTQIGVTYPRRAKGLVKKGRAVYVNDFTIRLSTHCPPANKEDIFNMKTIYFNAREWRFNPKVARNVGERSFITDLEGGLSECYMIGDWKWNWTEICTKYMKLEKDSDYTFIFWLNGGERDDNAEVCQLQVVFTNGDDEETQYEDWANRGISKEEWNNRLIYKLNRSFIKPIKKVRGWELYEIPFHTENKEFTQLRFVANGAYMTIMPAKDKEYYAEWQDELDPFEGQRPQRHNMVFEDGWPTNTWYATKNLAQNPKSSSKIWETSKEEAKNWADWAKKVGEQAAAEAKKVSEQAAKFGSQAVQKSEQTVIHFGDKLCRIIPTEDIKQYVLEKLQFADKKSQNGSDDSLEEDMKEGLKKRVMDQLYIDDIFYKVKERMDFGSAEGEKLSDEDFEELLHSTIDEVLDEELDGIMDSVENVIDEARDELDKKRDELEEELDKRRDELEEELDACQEELDGCQDELDEWRDNLDAEIRSEIAERIKEIFTMKE